MPKQFYFKQSNFAYVRSLNVKTVLFQVIQFCISTQLSSILTIGWTLFGATTPDQSGCMSDSNEEVLRIPLSSSISGNSPSDGLVSYPGLSLGDYYPFTEKRSVHSTGPADRPNSHKGPKTKQPTICNFYHFSSLGFTYQYLQMNALLNQLGNSRFDFLGFPCNQFSWQEPGANKTEILNGLKYVRPGKGYVPAFELMTKIDVNGMKEDPLYTFLKVNTSVKSSRGEVVEGR